MDLAGDFLRFMLGDGLWEGVGKQGGGRAKLLVRVRTLCQLRWHDHEIMKHTRRAILDSFWSQESSTVVFILCKARQVNTLTRSSSELFARPGRQLQISCKMEWKARAIRVGLINEGLCRGSPLQVCYPWKNKGIQEDGQHCEERERPITYEG
jgi:hypothetical protein